MKPEVRWMSDRETQWWVKRDGGKRSLRGRMGNGLEDGGRGAVQKRLSSKVCKKKTGAHWNQLRRWQGQVEEIWESGPQSPGRAE